MQGAALLALGLQKQPDAVANPWHLVLQHPETLPLSLPAGTRITQVYDGAEGELLILGAPGSGKTTLLLELARDLLARAEQDESHPMPVVFNLSSWATKQQSLQDWLVEELNTKYQVPRKLATTLLEAEQILPLLDGLDEVATRERTQCIETINRYRREHGTQSLVICSRSTDYLTQTSRVLLGSAVLIQPLTPEHVEQALRAAGPAFSGLRAALQQQQTLRDLATTPLMLSVLLLTYQGVSVESMGKGTTDLEQRVWTDYVARMVRPRGRKAHTSLGDTRHWLTSLAQQMRVHQQTIFYAEYVQPDWLAAGQQRTLTWLATHLPAMVIGGCVGILVWLLMGGDGDPVFLLQFGLLGGFVGSCLSLSLIAEPIGVRSHLFTETQAHFRNALLLGLLLVASNSLSLHQASEVSLLDPSYLPSDWLRAVCVLGQGSLISGWTFQILLDRTPKPWVAVLHTPLGLRGSLATWMNTMGSLHLWQAALVFGGGMGLSFGLIYGLNVGLIYGFTTAALQPHFFSMRWERESIALKNLAHCWRQL